MSRVSLEAELTFAHLILVVDDFGRFDARPRVLANRLFPTRNFTPDKVMKWVEELAEEGCVVLYEAGSRPYLYLTGWEKHRGRGRRAESSKYPDSLDPRISEDFLGSPATSAEIRPRDEGREARDEKREARKRRSAPLSREEQLDDPALLETLAATETKLGILYPPDEIALWLAWVRSDLLNWTQKDGKPYSNMWSAATNWWRNVKPEDFEKARRADQNRRYQAKFGDRLEDEPQEPAPEPVVGWGARSA